MTQSTQRHMHHSSATHVKAWWGIGVLGCWGVGADGQANGTVHKPFSPRSEATASLEIPEQAAEPAPW